MDSAAAGAEAAAASEAAASVSELNLTWIPNVGDGTPFFIGKISRLRLEGESFKLKQ